MVLVITQARILQRLRKPETSADSPGFSNCGLRWFVAETDKGIAGATYVAPQEDEETWK